MGLPMARHLVEAGFSVAGWARRPEARDRAAAAGVELRPGLADVAAGADFVVTMVTTSTDVEELALGPGGLLTRMEPGSVLVDMSTIAPATSRAVAAAAAARGVDFLDAPVSGGSFGAEAGTLTIMAGGDAGVFARCRPLFEAMGNPDRLFHTGPAGSGEVVKLVNNMLVGTVSLATLEALLVGVRAGVDLDTLVDVISVSSGSSIQLTGQLAQRGLRGRFEPGFMTALLLKDLRLGLDLAAEAGQDAPQARLAEAAYAGAVASGHSTEDYSAILLELEKAAGVQLRLRD